MAIIYQIYVHYACLLILYCTNFYTDAYVDMILADGITLLCNDIQVTVSECKLKFLDSFIFIVYIYSPVCNHRVCCKDVNSTCKLQALIPEILFGIWAELLSNALGILELDYFKASN